MKIIFVSVTKINGSTTKTLNRYFSKYIFADQTKCLHMVNLIYFSLSSICLVFSSLISHVKKTCTDKIVLQAFYSVGKQTIYHQKTQPLKYFSAVGMLLAQLAWMNVF